MFIFLCFDTYNTDSIILKDQCLNKILCETKIYFKQMYGYCSYFNLLKAVANIKYILTTKYFSTYMCFICYHSIGIYNEEIISIDVSRFTVRSMNF